MPMPALASPTRLLRRPEVKAITGLSNTTRDELEFADRFPRRVRLTEHGRAVGWVEAEVTEWVAGRVAARNDGRR
jgi:prophage regulatory protein